MKRILLFTATGQKNLWDELILLSEYRELRTRYPEAHITIATYDRTDSLIPRDPLVSYISYFPSHFRAHPIKNLRALWDTVRSLWMTNLVIIGGGGLFYDTESGQSFKKLAWQWSLRIALAQFFQKKIFYWAISIDLSRAHLESIAWFFRYTRSTVSVRDPYSQKLLESIGVVAERLADSVFLVEPEVSPVSSTKPLRVGLALRSGYLREEDETLRGIVAFVRARGYEVVLCSHSLHETNPLTNDATSFARIAQELDIPITLSLQETLDIYPTLHAMIAMRLHAIILSVNYTLPSYVISYGSKTRSLAEDLGLSYIQDAAKFDLGRFIEQFTEFEGARAEAILAIWDKSDILRSETHTSLSRIFHGL